MIKLIFLIVLIFHFNNIIQAAENRIIFKINDSVFTSLDLEKRLEYLDFVGSNNNIDISIVTDDFILDNNITKINIILIRLTLLIICKFIPININIFPLYILFIIF